jgi:hypothetical protein
MDTDRSVSRTAINKFNDKLSKFLPKFDFLNVIIFLIYFLITLYVIYRTFPIGLRSEIPNLGIIVTSSPEQIRELYGQGDAGSYLDVALSLSKFRGISPEQYFYIHTWAPGQPIFLTLLILLTKLGIPIFISAFVINVFFWVFFSFIVHITNSNFSVRLIFHFFYILFLLSSDMLWMVHSGLLYSEGLSNIFFMYSFYLTFHFIIRNNLTAWRIMLISMMISASMLIRYTLENGYVLTIFVLLVFLFYSVISKQKKYTYIFAKLITIFLIAFLITVPWRIMNKYKYDMDTFALSNTSSWSAYGIWLPDSDPVAMYWAPYGGNWACRVDPIKCTEINSKGLTAYDSRFFYSEAIKSALSFPTKFVAERFGILDDFYIGNSPNKFKDFPSYFSLSTILMCFPLLFFLFKKRDLQIKLPFVIITPTLLSGLIFFLLTHYEYRYFINFKISIFLLFLLLIKMFSESKLNTKSSSTRSRR